MKAIKKYEIKVVETNTEFQYSDFRITRSADASNILREIIGSDMLICESFVCLFISMANKPLGFAKISTGGISATTVDIRLIAKYCIDTLCSAVILGHNHPSGNLQPSKADIELTDKIKKALAVFPIQVLDHQILTESEYYSFADEGIL
jgi:DNA repair protein RadC